MLLYRLEAIATRLEAIAFRAEGTCALQIGEEDPQWRIMFILMGCLVQNLPPQETDHN